MLIGTDTSHSSVIEAVAGMDHLERVYSPSLTANLLLTLYEVL